MTTNTTKKSKGRAVALYAVERLREPSTLGILGAAVIMFGGSLELAEGVKEAVGGVAMLAGVLLPERGRK